MSTGHATRVEMPNPLNVVLDGPDHITFHDLHVIDVIKQLYPWRIHALHHGDAESRVVALIPTMIDAAVEELHADGNTELLRKRRAFSETVDAVVDGCGIVPHRVAAAA